MAGSAIAAARMFTKTGQASRVSVTKEITIGLVLGFAGGALFKVRWGERRGMRGMALFFAARRRVTPRAARCLSFARLFGADVPVLFPPSPAGRQARRSAYLNSGAPSPAGWVEAPFLCVRGRANARAPPPRLARPPHLCAHSPKRTTPLQAWHWNERRKIEEYYKAMETSK
jgi:hypothetical protein